MYPSIKSRALAPAALAAAISAALIAPAAAPAQSGDATTVSRVQLQALNNSGASGDATLRLSADRRTLTVQIRATGLEPGGPHISHIHGLSAGGAAVDSTCPGMSEDADRDGFVELDEGGVKYGPILIDFGNVDPDADGRVNFTTTVSLSGSEMALPLDMRHIVVHGLTVPPGPGAGTQGEVNGTNGYLVVLPVLCGEIRQVGNGR
jgi:Cu/Zn superoxide dismutase